MPTVNDDLFKQTFALQSSSRVDWPPALKLTANCFSWRVLSVLIQRSRTLFGEQRLIRI